MRIPRKVMPAVLATIALLAGLGVSVAHAQFHDDVLRSLDFINDVPRSPRLLGMGGLSLVIPDRDQSITLWNFAASPVGVAAQDTQSTVNLWPATASASGRHDAPVGVRQDLGGRLATIPFEAFHRDDAGNAFGMVGRMSSVHSDTPFSDDKELRRSVGLPEVMPIMTGPFPYFGKNKLIYALRLRFGGEHLRDQYKSITENAAGEFLSLDGATLNPPGFFSPDEYRVNTSGAGVALAYPITKQHTLALGFDAVQEKIKGSNNGLRYSGEQREKRPYAIGQATLVGHLGHHLDYGVDGHAWTSQSEQDWVFSLSGGVGANPLSGRGKLLVRKEEGSSLNSRLRWSLGRIELGGQFRTQAGKLTTTPPGREDATSFNRFLDQLYYVQGADTLAKPDSIVANEARGWAWGYGVGASYKLARGVAGVEYHWGRQIFSQELNGAGPKRIAWDVRAGYEFPCNKVITGRVGYGYQWLDRDDFTRGNEYTSQTATMGMGIHPAGTSWTVETGYQLGFQNSDFGDPSGQRASRQQLAMQLRWTF